MAMLGEARCVHDLRAGLAGVAHGEIESREENRGN